MGFSGIKFMGIVYGIHWGKLGCRGCKTYFSAIHLSCNSARDGGGLTDMGGEGCYSGASTVSKGRTPLFRNRP